MDLLKELPLNFRWYLLHTTTDEIIILYYKSPADIASDESDTIIETTYFQTVLSKYKFKESDTIKKTRNDNEKTIDEFNNDIEKYCLSFDNINEIRLINTQYTHKILFENKVFTAMCKCSDNLYFELGYSGIRLSSNSYDHINKFEFFSGYLFPENTVTIKCNDYKITDININVYNGSTTNETAINFVINQSFKANSIRIYSTIKTVFTSGEMKVSQFDKSKLLISYLNLYGQEIIQTDKILSRIKIFGMKSVNIGEIEVDENNKYGNILNVNNITNFTLSRINRKVTELDIGTFLSIGNVGIVNIHNIDYKFTETSTFNKDIALISFLDDSNNLSRKINIFNSDVSNISSIPFTIFKLNNINIEKIYISTCSFGQNINILKTNEKTNIKKFYISDTTINTDSDFSLPKVDKLNLTNVTFNGLKTLELNAPYIFITKGLYYFDKLILQNDSGLDKISTDSVEFHGNEIKISEELPTNSIFFDINSIFDIINMNINGIASTFNDTKFHSNNINFATSGSVNLIKSFFYMNEMDTNINCNGSICGTMMISNSKKDNTFNLKINDTYQKLNINSIDIISNVNTPVIKITTNVPINMNVYNSDNKYSYMSYSDKYDSTRTSKIEFLDDVTNIINHVVLTDSEKICEISKNENVFIITKK